MAYLQGGVDLGDGPVRRPHDDRGNVLADAQRRYAFDYRNRLVRVERVSDGAPLVTFEYDAFNRRVLKQTFDPNGIFNPGRMYPGL